MSKGKLHSLEFPAAHSHLIILILQYINIQFCLVSLEAAAVFSPTALDEANYQKSEYWI